VNLLREAQFDTRQTHFDTQLNTHVKHSLTHVKHVLSPAPLALMLMHVKISQARKHEEIFLVQSLYRHGA
jgi:hypothetical protein